MKKNMQMNCPNCKSIIDLDEILVSQFEQSIKDDLLQELRDRETELEQKKQSCREQEIKLAQEKEEMENQINSKVKNLLLMKEVKLKEGIRKEIEDENSLQMKVLADELSMKSAQLQELNKNKAEVEKLKRQMSELASQIELQKEKELSERLEQARVTLQQQFQHDSFLKLKEREKVIEDLKSKLDEAKRKADQGSMQLQGEVQELEIIELLREFHPADEISQSKKGANAADILQIVRTQNGSECGKIYYESKRTKNWSNEWVKKFKQDNINTKADILVLVTNALPKGTERYGIVDGVWLCNFKDVKELSLVLRYGLLKLQQVAITNVGRETKMEMLYKYLTSEDFKNIFESILTGFRSIQESHASEKLKMQRLWKEREKALEQILSNTVGFYGTIKGIGGAAVHEIPMLQFEKLKKAS